jgi:hypothetical protein
MADKPKKSKAKKPAAKKQVNKKNDKSIQSPATGLNVESTPKPAPVRGSQEKSILDKQNKKLDEIVAGSRKEREIQDEITKFHNAKKYASAQSALPKTEAPAFGPKNSKPAEAGPYQKNIRDTKKSDAYKASKAMKESTPKPSSFPESMKAAKIEKNASKNMVKGMSESAKDFPGKPISTASVKIISGMGQAAKQLKKEQKEKRLSKIATGIAGKVKKNVAKGYSESQSAKTPTQAPAFGPRNTGPSNSGPYQKNIKDTTKSDAWKHVKDMRSRYGFKAQNIDDIKDVPFKDPNYRPKTQAETESMWSKIKAQGAKKPVEKKVSQPKPAPTQPSKPKAATAPPAPKPTQTSDRKPSMAGGIAKAAATHIGMALMHGTNYPRVMAQHAAQGPREFKPGWHGFTSPVERPKAEEGTDTKGERG